MKETYFQRLHKYSPTRFWVNNPTPEQAKLSIKAGAINCTTNPTYAYKQSIHPETREEVEKIIQDAIKSTHTIDEAVNYVQQMTVKKILQIFLPLYEKNPERAGFVSIQGDPNKEEDADHIIKEAINNSKLGKNYIAKIPVTESGLVAIEACIAEGFPLIATEIMSISQMIALCELYNKTTSTLKKKPPLYVTHITGIYDQYIEDWVSKNNIKIPSDVLWYAGLAVCKKQYKIFKERKYPGIMLGGGARGFKHFTELTGFDMHITINWQNFADKLIEQNLPVINRYGCETPGEFIEELLQNIPDFKKAYEEDGLKIEEFQEFGPVELFRTMFLDGWNNLKNVIAKR